MNPKIIAKESKGVLKSKIKKLIIKLVSLKVAQYQNGDTALAQYSRFLRNNKVHLK